jgi:hypothetical protein
LIGHFIRVLFSIRISTIKVPAAASEKQSWLKRWKKNYASCCCAFCWAAEPHPTLPPWWTASNWNYLHILYNIGRPQRGRERYSVSEQTQDIYIRI